MSDIIDPGQEAVEAESVPRHPIHDRKGLIDDTLRAIPRGATSGSGDGNEQYVDVKENSHTTSTIRTSKRRSIARR
jgi:hypothetical protein